MQRFEFDDSAFPLLVVNTPSSFEDESFGELFRGFETLFERRQRYVLLLDTSTVSSVPTAKQRALINAWEKAHIDQTRRWNLGVALVVTSALVRGVLTALAWIVPDETVRVHVATRREAVDWCCARLEAERIALTPAIEALRSRSGA